MVVPLLQKSGNLLDIRFVDEVDTICTDQLKLRQVLFNVLSNANKFTSNGKIRLDVEKAIDHDKEYVVFNVVDTGIGMTPAQLDKVFEKFTQAEASTTSKYGGTGLGLAICKKICELLGGDISVWSQVNRGSVFTIKLPQLDPTILDSNEPSQARCA